MSIKKKTFPNSTNDIKNILCDSLFADPLDTKTSILFSGLFFMNIQI